MPREVTIVGAGPVGALLGIMLAQRGFRVGIYESRPDPRIRKVSGGRSINLTIAERGWKALREAGLETRVRSATLPLYGRMIHGEDGVERFQPYSAEGDAIYSASRARLAILLLDLADEQPNIRLHFNHRCVDVDRDHRALCMETPSGPLHLRPDVVFAADGAYSSVRRSLIRDPHTEFTQRLSPLVYKELMVPPAADGDFVFSAGALHLWPRGDCMIVAFPNLDRSFTVSLFMPAQGALSFGALTTRTELLEFFARLCPELLDHGPALIPDFFASPPAPLTSGSVRPWTYGNWLALIGDSAHTLVPFLGQGLNAGLEDCSVLGHLIDQFGSWDRILPAYEEARRENCEAVTRMAEQHFEELATATRDPLFVIRKALENKAHRLAPEHFVPLYTMVAFHNHPYLDIEQVRERQERILDRLMALPEIEDRWDSPGVEALLREEILALPATAPRLAAHAGD